MGKAGDGYGIDGEISSILIDWLFANTNRVFLEPERRHY